MVRKKVRYIKDLVKSNSKVSKSNLIWELDFFYFPKNIKNSNIKRQTYLSIVDTFSKYCIYVHNVTKFQKSSDIIFLVNSLIETANIKPKIIHTDYGIQFTSKE